MNTLENFPSKFQYEDIITQKSIKIFWSNTTKDVLFRDLFQLIFLEEDYHADRSLHTVDRKVSF